MISMLNQLDNYKINKQSKIYASAQRIGDGGTSTFTVRIC